MALAPLTEKNLPDQPGKVFIVTASTSGVGRDLFQILYDKNAKVYIAARSSSKAKITIQELKQKSPNSSGDLIFLQGSKTKQGFEQAAKNRQSEVGGERFALKGGVEMINLDYKEDRGAWHKYGVSKAGNIYHSKDFARRYGKDGIISLALDPGNLKTDLYTDMPKWQYFLAPTLALKPPIYGAYVELWAALSTSITMKDNGTFTEPLDKIARAREDVELGSKRTSEGGTGIAQQFGEWSEAQVAPFSGA